MSRFRLDTTKSPPLIVDTQSNTTMTIDETYERCGTTTDPTEHVLLCYILQDVENYAWEKVRRHHTKEIT